MNNLKRVLSLGLVGAMLSGMMIMGASAATSYTDAEDIVNVEAVEVMGALNIINGKDDGSFSPEENVTRSQMAKMIAVAMNGGKEPNFGVKTTPTFTDVKGHWAETFIEYCYDMKIINGRGDGTFDPDGNVTGVEAAKMVLSALGYEATAYQLTGPNWDSNVNRNATQVCDPSLYETVENTVMSQPITRDVAAQIIWNGMQNKTIEVNPDTAVSTGEVTNKYSKSNRNFLDVHYGAKIGYGWLTGNDKTESGLSEGHIQVSKFYLDTWTADQIAGATRAANFPYDTDLSLIGEKVKVIFKDGKQGTTNYPDKNDTIYGVFNANETEVVNVTMADVKAIEGDDQVLNLDGTKYDLANSVKVTFNFANDHANSKTYAVNVDSDGNFASDPINNLTGYKGDDGKWVESKLTQALKQTNGNTIKAVMNDSSKIDKIYVTETKLEFVTAVSSDKVTITNVGTIKKADNDIYDGVAKNDVVTVTTLYKKSATDDGAYNIVEEAEVITGEMTRYKDNTAHDNCESVTVDGTVYKVVDKSNNLPTNNSSKFVADLADDDLIGKEFELYMVNGFVGAAKQISEDASNYSVVLQVRTNGSLNNIFDDLKLQVMAADGTKTIISVADDSTKLNGDAVTAHSDFAAGDIVTYTVNKDNTATVSIKGKVATGADLATYDKSTKSVKVAANNKAYVTAADCVLFVDRETANNKVDYKAYTIRNLGDIKNSANYAMVLDKDSKVVAVSMRTATPAGAGSTRVYGMVTGFNGTIREDGTSYRQYTVSVNGEEYVVNQKLTAYNAASNKLAAGKIVSFEPTSDGIYEGANDFTVIADNVTVGGSTAKAVWVKEYVAEDGIISIFTGRTSSTVNDTTTYTGTGSFTYAVDDDVKMYYVDTDNDTAMEAGTVSVMNAMTGYKSAILIIDGNDNVVAIIAEVSGEADVTAQ